MQHIRSSQVILNCTRTAMTNGSNTLGSTSVFIRTLFNFHILPYSLYVHEKMNFHICFKLEPFVIRWSFSLRATAQSSQIYVKVLKARCLALLLLLPSLPTARDANNTCAEPHRFKASSVHQLLGVYLPSCFSRIFVRTEFKFRPSKIRSLRSPLDNTVFEIILQMFKC